MDIDPEFEIHLDSGFSVGLFGLGVALLMVALIVEFLLEFAVPNFWRQVVVLSPTVVRCRTCSTVSGRSSVLFRLWRIRLQIRKLSPVT